MLEINDMFRREAEAKSFESERTISYSTATSPRRYYGSDKQIAFSETRDSFVTNLRPEYRRLAVNRW
jgi:hypothetical protein